MTINFKNSDNYKKIFSFHSSIPNRIISRESSQLEFKESFNWNAKDKYAKTMAALANNKGGYIVFGVKDKPRDLLGLQSDNFNNIDEAKITEYLNNIFSPEIIFDKFIIKIQSKTMGLLYTHQSLNKPIVCLKNDGVLKESDIYYRYNARSEKIKYSELKILLDAIREEEQKSWMEHFEKISKIGPTNTAIMDTIRGEITGKSGTLVIDKKLIPKLKFINEGSFKKSRKPVLKLIGNVKPVSIISKSGRSKEMNVKITDNPNAPEYRLTTPDKLCPHITEITVAKINEKLNEKWKITNYDLLMIRYLYEICENPEYYYHPSSGASQYSDKFINWIINKYNQDNSFFKKNIEKYRKQK